MKKLKKDNNAALMNVIEAKKGETDFIHYVDNYNDSFYRWWYYGNNRIARITHTKIFSIVNICAWNYFEKEDIVRWKC